MTTDDIANRVSQATDNLVRVRDCRKGYEERINELVKLRDDSRTEEVRLVRFTENLLSQVRDV